MTSIDELRQTLETHASDVVDHDAGARSSAVLARVAGVRRRRHGLAAAGVAAVLVAAGAVAWPPGRDGVQPAGQDRMIAGVEAPRELSALGFTYEFERGVEGQGFADVGEGVRTRLDAVPEPRLVSWATSGAEDRVRIDHGSGSELVLDSPDFTDWIYVAPGDEPRIKINAERGEVGLAVYALTEDRPAGVTRDGITFRETRAGNDLLGATIGEQGEADITIPATGRSREIDYRYFCSGGPKGAYLHVETDDGEFISGSGCSDAVPSDPAALGGSTTRTGPGRDETTRFSVTQGRSGDLVDDPDLRIGLGLYDVVDTGRRAAGFTVPDVFEDAGHRWKFHSLTVSEPGEPGVVAPRPEGVGPLLAVGYAKPGSSGRAVRFLLQGPGRGDLGSSASGSSVWSRVSADGPAAKIRTRSGSAASSELAIAYFTRAD